MSRFEEFWLAYPKKVGKKPSLEVWKRKEMDRMTDAVIADVELRKRSDEKWRKGFIPNPQTYLNQERWDDQLEDTRGITDEDRTPRPRPYPSPSLATTPEERIARRLARRKFAEAARKTLGVSQ